eukprot:scaffold44025_cov58-Phaeocystis_antarctica.AAC.1
MKRAKLDKPISRRGRFGARVCGAILAMGASARGALKISPWEGVGVRVRVRVRVKVRVRV